MRLLFVDDEERILAGIENALTFAPDNWSADFASGGQEAIAALSNGHYDVLVTDMKMPGLTGADVLEWSLHNRSETVRIVLSGEVDAQLAHRAIPLTHEFVSKPCDPDDLFEIISRVHKNSQQLGNDEIRKAVGSLEALPSQPRLHRMVTDSIQRGEGVDAVASILEMDIGISASVVKTSNSAFYGFRTPATTVSEAVARLGIDTVSGILINLELGAGIPSHLAQFVETLNKHCVSTAAITRELVGEIRQAPLASLVHDVGVLMFMSGYPQKFVEVTKNGWWMGENTAPSERAEFGASHTEVGAYMLQMWNMEPLVVDAVRYHHDPDQASDEARPLAHAILAADIAMKPGETSGNVDPDLLKQARVIVKEKCLL